MKKLRFFLILCGIVSMLSLNSCRSSCPAYDNTSVKTNKKTGKLPNRKGSSNLFPKDMRRH